MTAETGGATRMSPAHRNIQRAGRQEARTMERASNPPPHLSLSAGKADGRSSTAGGLTGTASLGAGGDLTFERSLTSSN